MNDELLYKKCKASFIRLLELCRNLKESDSSTYDIQEILPVLDADGFAGCQTVAKINYDSFLLNHKLEIRNTSDYQDIINAFRHHSMFLNYYSNNISDESGETIKKPSPEQITPWVEEFLKDLILNFLELRKSFDYEEHTFLEVYSAMERYILNEHKSLYFFTPLYGLKGDFNFMKLDENTEINLLSPSHYAQIVDFDLVDNPSIKPNKKYWKLRYAIYIRLHIKDKKELSPANIEIRFKKVLESLRLFKEGFIHIGAIYPYSPNAWIRRSLLPRIGNEEPPDYESFLELNCSDTFSYIEFYRNYRDIPLEYPTDSIRFISIALRRFNTIYNDKFIEDKITNLTIALEYLLTTGPGELQSKLSIRGALFLGTDEEEREYLWRLIRKCYDIRSEIVHGKRRHKIQILDQTFTEHELLQQLEKLTRRALIKFIELQKLGKSQKDIIGILDVSAVNRKKLTFEN